MLKGFRDFIMRGNVVDLAVAVVIGAAFNSVVTSLVEDLLTPVVAASEIPLAARRCPQCTSQIPSAEAAGA